MEPAIDDHDHEVRFGEPWIAASPKIEEIHLETHNHEAEPEGLVIEAEELGAGRP